MPFNIYPTGSPSRYPTNDSSGARDPNARNADAGAAPVTPPLSSRPLILLIENNLDQAEPLRDILNLSGYDCDIAESIELARELLHDGDDDARRYDLMIADLRLNDPDDVKFVRDTRAMPGYATLPIIITTGFDSQEARKVGSGLRIADYLLKPVSSTNKLVPLIARWIRREHP